MLFRVDVDLLQLDEVVLRRGERIEEDARERLGLRRGRAKTLTSRIHVAFCALAAARVYRSDGCLSVDEIGTLDGWAREGSVAKLLANEFEFGAGLIQQLGRGSDAQLRLRLATAEIQVGELPDTVRKLFDREQSTSVPLDDLLPQPIVDRELATAVAEALRTASPDLTLQVRPAYQGGRSSLVFRGTAVRGLGSTRGQPGATTVLVKVPLGISGGKLAVNARALDHERRLLTALAGWPGLPARVEQHRIDLRPLGEALRRQHRVHVHDDALAMDALILPLGRPRTTESEPRVLRSILDETASAMRRLSRRDLHNALKLAERLARLLRMLHRERRAHRHVSVDSILVRHELGIFESVLAPDLAASVQTARGSDDLLYRDLFDLGRVLAHVITGAALSRERQNFQPPEFPGRRLIMRAVVGEGETVGRLLSTVSRYLLEAAPGGEAAHADDLPTVALLDHFLEDIEHIDMLHWARARGVPERRVSLAGATPPATQSAVPPREIWERSAADPVATRLVTISHLVDPATLRRWCERYATNHRWHLSIAARRDTAPGDPPVTLSAEDCLQMLRDGFGRSAAAEMWRYLWTAGPDEPAGNLARVLRNYATHWTREARFDIAHAFAPDAAPDGRAVSRGVGDELAMLRQRWAAQPDRQLLVDWIDVLKLLSPRNRGAGELRREAAAAAERSAIERAADNTAVTREYERLRSWLRAGALMQQLQSRTAPPAEKDIRALERTLQARSAPEIAFWHALLARAWAAAAAHGTRTETGDDEPAWDKAMRALLVAAGAASSRKLPYEMAATLLASAALTGLALATPELRAGFSSQGVDEESVRVQAAECALLAADAYQWLDAEHHNWTALLEAASLLQGSGFPERLIQAFQLVSLARNNRVLHRAQRPPDDRAADPPPRFERYPLGDDGEPGRTRRERLLSDETYRVWLTAAGRSQVSDDPGTVVALGFFARYVPGVRQLYRSSAASSSLSIELSSDPSGDPAKPVRAVDRLLELVGQHYGQPVIDRILDFGCGAGDDARYLARRHQVWAVDSPLRFAMAREDRPADAAAPRFIELDPVELARRICDGRPLDGCPAQLDVVLFRCSLCRISQRALVLQAAHRLLRPGGLVVATDWVQTRVTDRTTWARVVGAARFVDLETEPGYRRLCSEQQFVDFVSWDTAIEPGAGAPAMHRWAQRRLDELRRLEDERGRPHLPYERAFLLLMKRDLEALAALSTADGPLGWLFWAARKPLAGHAGE